MSSFLVATLAIFAHPAPFGTRPSVKKRSTRGLVKRWIATWIHHTLAQYTVSRYVHSGQHTDARPAPVAGGMERPFDPRRLRRPLSPRCVRSNARSCGGRFASPSRRTSVECLKGGRTSAPAAYLRTAFHCAYSSGRHTAHGRYPAATAVCSSAKNTRFLTYWPRAIARSAARQSSLP